MKLQKCLVRMGEHDLYGSRLGTVHSCSVLTAPLGKPSREEPMCVARLLMQNAWEHSLGHAGCTYLLGKIFSEPSSHRI